MKLLWTRRARNDLLEIATYIARDKVEAALNWVDKLQERAEKLVNAPRAARIVPELERDDIREAIVGNYRIVYRIEPDRLVVLTVFEGHRLLKNAIGQLDDDVE